MKWLENMLPNILRKFDHYLLIHYPDLWRTRLHYVVLICGTAFGCLVLLGYFSSVDFNDFLANPDYTSKKAHFSYLTIAFPCILGIIYWRNKLSEFTVSGRAFWPFLLLTICYIIGASFFGHLIFAYQAGFSQTTIHQTERLIAPELEFLEDKDFLALDFYPLFTSQEQLLHQDLYFTNNEVLNDQLNQVQKNQRTLNKIDTILNNFIEYVAYDVVEHTDNGQNALYSYSLDFYPLYSFIKPNVKQYIFNCSGGKEKIACFEEKITVLTNFLTSLNNDELSALALSTDDIEELIQNKYISNGKKNDYRERFLKLYNEIADTAKLGSSDLMQFNVPNLKLGFFPTLDNDELTSFIDQYGHWPVWSKLKARDEASIVQTNIILAYYSYAFYESLDDQEVAIYRQYRQHLIDSNSPKNPLVVNNLMELECSYQEKSKTELLPLLDERSAGLYEILLNFLQEKRIFNNKVLQLDDNLLDYDAILASNKTYLKKFPVTNRADSLYFQNLMRVNKKSDLPTSWSVDTYIDIWRKELLSYYTLRHPSASRDRILALTRQLNLKLYTDFRYSSQQGYDQREFSEEDIFFADSGVREKRARAKASARDSLMSLYPPNILTPNQQFLLRKTEQNIENECRTVNSILTFGLFDQDWRFAIILAIAGFLLHFLSINPAKRTLINLLVNIIILTSLVYIGNKLGEVWMHLLLLLPLLISWGWILITLAYSRYQLSIVNRFISLVVVYTALIILSYIIDGSTTRTVLNIEFPPQYILYLFAGFFFILHFLYYRYQYLPSKR